MSQTDGKPAKRGPGQPTLLTNETQDRIVSVVRSGAYLDDAAMFAGVSRSTVMKWLARGRKAEDAQEHGEQLDEQDLRCLSFYMDVEAARAEAAVRNLALVQAAAQNGVWQAAAWYLERTNPRKWGRHETVEVTGADGGPIQVEHSVKDTLRAKFEQAERVALEVLEATVIDQPTNDRQEVGNG